MHTCFAQSHTPLVQSALELHGWPSEHSPHDPPQSVPVSSPFLMLSTHDGAAQVEVAGSHTPLAQWIGCEHAWPMVQPTQAPPQSTPHSLPFFVPSKQVASSHNPALPHTALAQSVDVVQPEPVEQASGHEPPQSTSASSPFFAPSMQRISAPAFQAD